MTISYNAVYVDGQRVATPASITGVVAKMRQHDGIGWINLVKPSPAEIREAARVLGLHALAVEDAVEAHQRSKLERYDDTLFIVLHPARYLAHQEIVEFAELHLFVGPKFVVTVNHGDVFQVEPVRAALEMQPQRLALGPQAILHAILDKVVDEYSPIVAGLEDDIDEIEDKLFSRSPEVSQRIYEVSREVIDFQRATKPLVEIVRSLQNGSAFASFFDAMMKERREAVERHFVADHTGEAQEEGGCAHQESQAELAEATSEVIDLETRRGLRDVLDHAIAHADRANEYRSILDNAMQVHATLVAQEQNTEMQRMTEASLKQGDAMKKISSWAAIIFAPSLIGSIYGMNFRHMPELSWRFGYPFALALMVIGAVALYKIFKRADWI